MVNSNKVSLGSLAAVVVRAHKGVLQNELLRSELPYWVEKLPTCLSQPRNIKMYDSVFSDCVPESLFCVAHSTERAFWSSSGQVRN